MVAVRKITETKDLVIIKSVTTIIAVKVVMNFIFEDGHIYSLLVAAITVVIVAY